MFAPASGLGHDEPVASLRCIDRCICIGRDALSRPCFANASVRSLQCAFAMDIGGFISCCNVKAGLSAEPASIGFIGWRGCKCAINRRDDESWPNSGRTGQKRLRRMIAGRWIGCAINSTTVVGWVLTIVDNFSRVSPALWVGHQAKTSDVVSALNRAITMFGKPRSIRVDNGSQFTSREFDLWAYANGVIVDYSRPGKPTDNAFVESFNARVRLECLNQHCFLDLDDARTKVESWRRDYNDVRPHSAIGERTPMIVFTAHRDGPVGSTGPDTLN